LLIVICGYLFGWKWTGLVAAANYPKKTLWDWLDLLIVPVVLAIGGYLFTRSESQRTQEDTDQQRSLDRELADERRQDDMLQAYLDGMSQLLTDKDRPLHRAQRGDNLSAVARARTLTVLTRLDGERKGSVVLFLFESGLIGKDRVVLPLAGVDLSGAYLIKSYLFEANLSGTNLSGATLSKNNLIGADLRRADLSWIILEGADLSNCDLSEAVLEGADLFNSKLNGAKLNGVILFEANLSNCGLGGADFSKANLIGADLTGANLSEANLMGANLYQADLTGAKGWTYAQLRAAKSLEGATMPDGKILGGEAYPDGATFDEWVKDREGHKEAGENE
jgi:uncharacterized protein YjbI with pentapeptide repeats